MPNKRQVGCHFLLVTSLSGTAKQEKSDSPSAGGRNALKATAHAKATNLAKSGECYLRKGDEK
jgi:hypothetical protein